MNCLIIGTGGVGGSIAGFLALAGHKVTCIARGVHLEQMLQHGLRLHSDLKGECHLPVIPFSIHPPEDTPRVPHIHACSAEEYQGTAALIIVCVKGYSVDSITACIRRAATPDTLVLPILNVYGTGPRIARSCPGIKVLDGCIYIVAYINAPGEITQMGSVFKLIFGARPEDQISPDRLLPIRDLFLQADIKAILSDDINRDTFAKWGFISAMALTGAYYNVPMGALQKEGPERDTFIGLTRESTALGEKLGIHFREDPILANLRVIDALAPESTASLQKDITRGHESEIQGQLFDLIDAAEAHGVDIPTYRMIEKKFRQAFPSPDE